MAAQLAMGRLRYEAKSSKTYTLILIHTYTIPSTAPPPPPPPPTTIRTMAAFTLDAAPITRDFGRSGYNKDDDDATKGNKGRSGFSCRPEANANKSLLAGGRGGNARGDDKDDKNGGRSGYN
ncbi:uncharacterized protein F5Z01DRAFT_676202 [Emericellopsis atlantica]|uniref:Uncharacterized protein n=1 Tax=Emericellopsis atlantica TaxID=2614577 RepID=A0A9P7ZHQ0_9HYPO|nr:uncharacterized protein F5Z01DRAFT_676202 [Emericellopsis atlantica]KAG9252323.1 hypothetical protein F5Z01DRAFT_676202 [Emericellopsis atlantica]